MRKITHIVLVFCISCVFFITHTGNTKAAPPSGFQSTEIISSGIDQPTGFDIAPDGRIFILEKGGKVKIYKNGQLLLQPFYEFSVNAIQDRGLLGIAFDPDFITNKYVYFYYCGSDLSNYVVRLVASGDIFSGTPFILYTTPPPSTVNHAGGTLRFGQDRKLYLSLGENGFAPNAQDFTTPYGKIIRLNPDGSIPSDNPFVGQEGVLSEIWAYGLRNPFRFQFDTTTGDMYAGDVGQDSWEEVNTIIKSKNYGWPFSEGSCSGCEFENPLYQYGDGRAVVGGPVYQATMFPEEYRGSYFFGDYVGGFIKRIIFNTDKTVQSVVNFDSAAGAVVDLKVAPDGSLYYVTIFPGKLIRISYALDNQIPYAHASASVVKGNSPLSVSFSSVGSADPDGTELSYIWNFGDGTTTNEQNPTKIFSTEGLYMVTLSISDGVNEAHAPALLIEVGEPPTLTITSPLQNDLYKAGDTIHFSARAQDSDGSDIPKEQFTTQVILHHATHIHPYITLPQTREGDVIIPTRGEGSADTWYEFIISVKGTNGLIITKNILMYPEKTTFMLATQPSGLLLNLDGIPITAPKLIEGVVGFERLLDAPLQKVGNIYYEFVNWSNNQNNKHYITTTNTHPTYTATFQPLSPFKAEYFSNKNLDGQPILTREESFIDFNWGSTSPDPIVPANNFSARFSKKSTFSTGRYRFTTTTDDGLRLYLDNTLLIDKWINQGPTTYTKVVDIPAGDHEIKMEYFDSGGDAQAHLTWDLSPQQIDVTPSIITLTPTPSIIPQDTYKAEYFSNKELIGSPVYTTHTQTIDYNWGNTSEQQSIPLDNFSARFSKKEQFSKGYYEFTLQADDGVRLFIDGTILLNKWIHQSARSYTVNTFLDTGQHDIRLEYFENGGDARIVMNYKQLATDQPQFIAEYFNNTDLSGNPVVQRSEESINYNFGTESPDGVRSDNFSARWMKEDYFSDGIYSFTVTADDGVRLFLDDELLLDKWFDQPATTYTIDSLISQGNHTIRLEYYEKWADARISFSYNKASGFDSTYWNISPTDEALVIPQRPPDFSVQEDALVHSWGDNKPYKQIQADFFGGRMKRIVSLDSGNYVFQTQSDDGVRVYIDDKKVIDEWHDHSLTTHTKEVYLGQGTHLLTIEYYDRYADATLFFDFNKLPDTTLSGFMGEYFSNKELAGSPLFMRIDPRISFFWSDGAADESLPADNFSVRWTKTKDYEEGNYVFSAQADDGIRIWIDSDLMIDDWTNHSLKNYTFAKNLHAGEHTIKIEYFENGGDASILFEEN